MNLNDFDKLFIAQREGRFAQVAFFDPVKKFTCHALIDSFGGISSRIPGKPSIKVMYKLIKLHGWEQYYNERYTQD